MKYGEWKDGKRARWLGDEEIEELKKQGKLNLWPNISIMNISI